MTQKVTNDFYYSDVAAENLVEAGFFEDSRKAEEYVRPEDTLDIITAPLAEIRKEYKAWGQQAILLGVGCFAPIHSGHVDMMKAAKHELTRRGYRVWGFLSPDHDDYIKTKTDRFAIDYRIQLIREQIKDEPWLKLDLWASMLAPTAINFTEVLRRFELMIQKYVGDIPVFLVVGGDNARFIKAFPRKGRCIIVGRPGYEHAYMEYAPLVDNQRSFAIWNNNAFSSTIERALHLSSPRKKDLILRVNSSIKAENGLLDVVAPYFRSVTPVTVSEQETLYDTEVRYNGTPVISLDPLISGDYNLGISRIYDFMGMDKLGYDYRPGWGYLADQLAKIPNGEYLLYDDDICTGGTMDFVEKLLADNGKKVVGRRSFVNSSPDTEVLDARDFLWRGENSGLVIQSQYGVYLRKLYALPHVVPSVRASVLDSKAFSRDIENYNNALH